MPNVQQNTDATAVHRFRHPNSDMTGCCRRLREASYLAGSAPVRETGDENSIPRGRTRFNHVVNRHLPLSSEALVPCLCRVLRMPQAALWGGKMIDIWWTIVAARF